MVDNYAVIEGGEVVNVALAEDDFAQDQGWVLLTEGYGIGDLYDGSEFSKKPDPEPINPIPQEVEGWQAEVAMRATPVDPDDPESQSVWDRVQDLIAAMPDGIQKITAQTVLSRGKIRRDGAMLTQLAPMVPLDSGRVDDLLRLAASIEA